MPRPGEEIKGKVEEVNKTVTEGVEKTFDELQKTSDEVRKSSKVLSRLTGQPGISTSEVINLIPEDSLAATVESGSKIASSMDNNAKKTYKKVNELNPKPQQSQSVAPTPDVEAPNVEASSTKFTPTGKR